MDLTKRETEILELAAKGLADKEIAREIFISVRTVNAHFARIYLKNSVKNRAEAVAKYFENYYKKSAEKEAEKNAFDCHPLLLGDSRLGNMNSHMGKAK